jgi:hypothetical protein
LFATARQAASAPSCITCRHVAPLTANTYTQYPFTAASSFAEAAAIGLVHVSALDELLRLRSFTNFFTALQ